MINRTQFVELQHKNMEYINRIQQKIDKTEEFIRKLYEYKKLGKVSPEKIKEFEIEIEKIIKYLERTFREKRLISVNFDINSKYMDLMMLWNSYKSGMEIKSKQEEELEAKNLLDNLMGDYNREHYGVGKK